MVQNFVCFYSCDGTLSVSSSSLLVAFYFKEVIKNKQKDKYREQPDLLIAPLKAALPTYLLNTFYCANKQL